MDSKVGLCSDVAKVIADYVVGGNESSFGRREWRKYFEVDVGREPELPFKEFYKFWHGPDPIYVTKQICETHLPPILRPRFVTYIPTNTLYPYSLSTMRQFTQDLQAATHPHPLQEDIHPHYSEALLQSERIKAGPACWLVARKGVIARSQSYAKQTQLIKNLNIRTKADYEEEPSIIDLATVATTRYRLTGERYLGDRGGIEQWLTFSRCKEAVKYGPDTYQLVVGGFGPDGLRFDGLRRGNHEYLGIAALRKF